MTYQEKIVKCWETFKEYDLLFIGIGISVVTLFLVMFELIKPYNGLIVVIVVVFVLSNIKRHSKKKTSGKEC